MIIDTGYGIQCRAKSFISAFCPMLLASLRDFEVSRVKSPGGDILDENARIELQGSFLFDGNRTVDMTSICGQGFYVPQVGEVVTLLRMLSTGATLVMDVWRGGFLFYDRDNAVIMTARAETALNLPHGSILANIVNGSDGILQAYIHESGLQDKIITAGDAYYITEATDVAIAYNPMGQSDFPVLPSFGGSGSA